MLKLLLQNSKKVYTKEQIYFIVWNNTYFDDETTIFFMTAIIINLLIIILYQRFIFNRGIQTTIRRINGKPEAFRT